VKISSKNYIIKTFTIVFIILIFINHGMAENTVGLIMNDTTQSYNGYTLFTPNVSTATYLIDNNGNLVNQWDSEYVPALSAYLLDDGSLLRSAKVEHPTDPTNNPTGGFQKFDWDGDLIWEFYYGSQHHDIEPMPNGNVLLVTNDRKPKNIAIQAGRDTNLIDGNNIRALSILEIEYTGPTTGNIFWRWDAWDHLIQDFDSTKTNFGVVSEHPELIDINYAKTGASDWLHTNSVAYNEALDQIIVSNRNINEIWVIDHRTADSDILYRWGNPQAYRAGEESDQKLYAQHDAHWITPVLWGRGNILVFSNGIEGTETDYSSVIEIEPPVDNLGNYTLNTGSAYEPITYTWEYASQSPGDFTSPRYGGSQRLPNGNTLVCNSGRGEFFELNKSNEIVWKYINPVAGTGVLTQGDSTFNSYGVWVPNNQVFRCYKFEENYLGLVDKDLTPGDPIELYSNVGIHDNENVITKFKLYDNYPNPFNPMTNIEFSLDERTFVTITIYDLVGNTIKTLVNDLMEPGFKTIKWDSRDNYGSFVSSGIYFYSLQAGYQNQTKKMILLR